MVEIFSSSGMEDMQSSLQDAFSKMFSGKKEPRKVTVSEAFEILKKEEAQRLVDSESVIKKAIRRTEQSGIIFLDEIDKIASGGGAGSGSPDVSRYNSLVFIFLLSNLKPPAKVNLLKFF